MIKMQVKTVHQAKCPFCGVTKTVPKADLEIYCYCDERHPSNYSNPTPIPNLRLIKDEL